MINIDIRDYDYDIYQLSEYHSATCQGYWGRWQYKFVFDGSRVTGSRPYQTFKGAETACLRTLTNLIRGKLKDACDTAIISAESVFINEYYNATGEIMPKELFEKNNMILKRVIKAYLEEAEIKVILT